MSKQICPLAQWDDRKPAAERTTGELWEREESLARPTFPEFATDERRAALEAVRTELRKRGKLAPS